MESKLGDDEIVGRSFTFQKVLNLVRRVANTDSVTLIQGETGTGKELIDFSFCVTERQVGLTLGAPLVS